MSASATGDGAKEAERVGQLTIPPTITTIRNTSETVPMNPARNPCRATGTRAATEPAVMIRRLYHHFNGNTVDQRLTPSRRLSSSFAGVRTGPRRRQLLARNAAGHASRE